MESNNREDGGSYQLPKCRRVGLLYDDRMCKHATPNGEDHPENPNRILSIWNKLKSSDSIIDRCVVMTAKEAEKDHIALVHTTSHINLIKDISTKKFNSRRNKIAARFNSIYFNEGSSEAASLAAGSVIEVAEKVANGELDSAFAIVRPPGHHAEEGEPMGFCLYNNVAIAASFLLDTKPELGIKKILIVDWDVHHGNGTQKTFWKDPRVLFFSVHRHEFGSFYPTGDDGFYTMIGEGPGAGYNINVPWENDRCGDADYLAVWDHVLIPVAEAFGPDLIIISAGFDAAMGDPLGGCCVSPYGYAIMLSKLMKFAGGKIVMALEGGYNLTSIANSAHACLDVLLYDKPITGSPETHPFESTWRVINAVLNELSAYWPLLSEKLPEKVICKTIPHVQILSSDSEDEIVTVPSSLSENHETDIENVIKPLLNLKIEEDTTVSSSWRSQLSKIDVWYASYGSNMRKSRLLCYIGGGQVEGMRKQCTGSVDKSPPKGIMWGIFPHRLFFARDYTTTWGTGGVAFLNPESCSEDKAYMCLYRITLEQFNDVLLQENSGNYDMESSLFDSNNLAAVKSKKALYVEALKGGWYQNVVYLGDEADIPILTMTCTTADVDSFKSGKFAVRPPGKDYVNTMVTGLVEGNQLSEEEAIAYIEDATTKALSMSGFAQLSTFMAVGVPASAARVGADRIGSAAGEEGVPPSVSPLQRLRDHPDNAVLSSSAAPGSPIDIVDDDDHVSGDLPATRTKRIAGRQQKRKRTRDTAALWRQDPQALEDISLLSDSDMAYELRQAHRATHALVRESVRRLSDPDSAPDVLKKKIRDLEGQLLVKDSALAGLDTQVTSLTAECQGLFRDLALMRQEKDDMASELGRTVPEMQRLKEVVQSYPQQLSTVEAEAVKRFKASDELKGALVALMGPVMSGGYTAAIDEMMALMPDLDISALPRHHLYRIGMEEVYVERAGELFRGVNLVQKYNVPAPEAPASTLAPLSSLPSCPANTGDVV